MSGRRRYTDTEKAAAINAYVNGGKSLDDVAAEVGCSKTTVRDWLIKAGVNPGDVAAQRGTADSQTEAATSARLAKAAANRAELLDLLRGDITLPAARLIARKLTRAEDDEELVELARGRWRDCLIAEEMAAEFGPSAVKDAKIATAKAKVDVMVAEAGTPDINDLSLVLRRSVTDLLAIEGYDHELAEEDSEGRLTVVFTAPRPNGDTTIVQLTQEA